MMKQSNDPAQPVRDCLIIAAGLGTRLADLGPSKPLVPLHGRPLIEWIIRRAAAAGLERFRVVTGFRADELRGRLQESVLLSDLSVEFVHNPDWQRPNGLSVLAAADCLDRPFVLLMADHLFDPEIIRRLLRVRPDEGGVILAVDRRLQSPLIDPDDVTRVRTAAGRIVDIGKGLAVYDCYDTGIFFCSPGLFPALAAAACAGDCSLSGGIRVLAAAGLAKVFDIGNRLWIDVDDEVAYRKAEELVEPGTIVLQDVDNEPVESAVLLKQGF